jgi:hypothetical protein
MQYVGETRNRLKLRMAQHRSTVKHNDPEKPVAIHFNGARHATKDISVSVIRHNEQWTNTQRQQTERAVIELFQTSTPFGMNIL